MNCILELARPLLAWRAIYIENISITTLTVTPRNLQDLLRLIKVSFLIRILDSRSLKDKMMDLALKIQQKTQHLKINSIQMLTLPTQTLIQILIQMLQLMMELLKLMDLILLKLLFLNW